MTASPDDAAASDVPPGAGVGPAAPSSPGTPGRRRPEEDPMSQQHPAPDETVRMRADDGGDGPPAPTSPAAEPASPFGAEPDDTRPVPRDWRSGGPDVPQGKDVPPPTAETPVPAAEAQDRKSTRLNSSHANISYAVFCLKKKNTSVASWSFI